MYDHVWATVWRVWYIHALFSQSLFQAPFVKSQRRPFYFEVGQPLGYLSSWPLFTLTHHLLVMYCADKVYPGTVLLRYAILGDDVCIADPQVAALYLQVTKELGVESSLSKSLVSEPAGFFDQDPKEKDRRMPRRRGMFMFFFLPLASINQLWRGRRSL